MPANIMQKYSCKTREGQSIVPGKFRLGSSSVYWCLGDKFVCCCIHNVYHFLLRSCADPIWSVPVMSLLILPLLSLSSPSHPSAFSFIFCRRSLPLTLLFLAPSPSNLLISLIYLFDCQSTEVEQKRFTSKYSNVCLVS